MSADVVTIPSRAFPRGSVVRRQGGGPNMLVVRSWPDRTVVVVCEGDKDGSLRLREYDTAGLAQVLASATEDRTDAGGSNG